MSCRTLFTIKLVFIEDRYIGERVRSIFDIMDFTTKQDIPGLLILIDFQKCLESFNFGPNFIRWVMTFYKNIQRHSYR